MRRAIQRFEVSLKAFIVQDGRALFVREFDTGWWELPGGRIDVGEEWDPHASILAREIAEELGPDLQLRMGTDVVTWMRQRPLDQVFLLIIARRAEIVSGTPVLSDEHSEMGWFDLEAARRLTFPEPSDYRRAIEALWA